MNMRTLLLMSIIWALICCVRAEIVKISSFDQASESLKSVTPRTLVVFDIDETIIYPVDAILQNRFMDSDEGKKLFREFGQKAGKRIWILWSIVALESARLLIEPCIPALITSLQSTCKVIALTKSPVGNIGKISRFEEFRYQQLLLLGIDFNLTFNVTMNLTKCTGKADEYPICYKGLLCTHDGQKGPVLGAFLDHLKLVSDNILFFDDLLENLESVQEELKKRNIPFHGYHYTAMNHMPDKLDLEIAKYQIDHLCNHEQWLSDTQAALAMKNITQV